MTKLNDLIQRGATADLPDVTEDVIYYYDTDLSTLYRNSGSAWESIEGTPLTGTLDQDDFDFFPGCAIYNSSNISIPNNTITEVTFDTDISDFFGMHSTTTDTGKVILPLDGSYIFVFQAQWAADSSGKRLFELYRDGEMFADSVFDPGGGFTINQQVMGILLDGEADDEIQVYVTQTSGSSVNLNFVSSETSPSLKCYFLGGKYS